MRVLPAEPAISCASDDGDAWHLFDFPLKLGDAPLGSRVAVIRLLPVPRFEGWATVVGPAVGEHRFLLRFAGDPIARERFVHPDWQADPKQALALLQQLWRAEATPAIADFYPEDAS